MSVNEAKSKFEAAKAAIEDCIAKKVKLGERLDALQSKRSEISIVDMKEERQKIVEAVAVGALSDSEYKKAIEKFGRAEFEYSALTEQIEVIKDAMSDTGDLLSQLQLEMNEVRRCLYLAIGKKLTEEVQLKMPIQDLQLLAVCKLRSGLIWGSDGWRNMLNELTGGGRFVAQELESDLKKQYGF